MHNTPCLLWLQRSLPLVTGACASSLVGGPCLAGRLPRVGSCQPHGTFLAEQLAASGDTKLSPAVLATLQDKGLWLYPVSGIILWKPTNWGTLLDRATCLLISLAETPWIGTTGDLGSGQQETA